MEDCSMSKNLGNNDMKVKVQTFGRFLSTMVMPNIGAFIAWGFITALFIPTGWIPSETLSKLVEPMIIYLLPLLIGYSGGKLVGGERGGVVGAIATSGVIVGTSIPMFMGAMIAGPVGGYAIKKFDRAVEGKIKAGFEMLINNFSAGIIGMILALIFFRVVGSMVEVLNVGLENAVEKIVEINLLPLTSIIVEPAKILFLNNAINHGVFSPLGIQQSQELGKSIFFLIEANPGPGLGILLAYMLFGKGTAKNSAPSATIIHFLGGIHEIYFPYVLMNPLLIIAVIFGGMSGVFTNVILRGGLIAPASPGSIFALLAMTPRGGFGATILSILVGGIVSCLTAMIILKRKGNEKEDLNDVKSKMKQMKNRKEKPSKTLNSISTEEVSKIIVACDAGMGSSAVGASLLRKKLKNAGIDIFVENRAINNLTEDVDIVITHSDLTSRAKTLVTSPIHLSVDNFINEKFYENLVRKLKNNIEEVKKNYIDKSEVLIKKGITLGLESVSKKQAIKNIGLEMAKLGYVAGDYYNYMIEREEKSTTYIGNNVAIPHGTLEGKSKVLKTGIVVNQYTDGIDFGDEKAYILIGIAGKDNEHVDIIANIANIIANEETVMRLAKTKSIDDIYNLFVN